MSQLYYQLGGYNSQLKWTDAFWDDTALIELIAGPLSPLKEKSPDGSIELVLGLKQSGASHLLLAHNDALEVASVHRLPRPDPSSAYTAYDFESVSPIVFKTKDQLSQKMRHLRLKKGGAPSQANRNYPDGTLDLYRGAFEHGRVFYRILNQIVDPGKYGVDDMSWKRQTRVLSFVFNVKGLEYRPTGERKLYPEVLDFGFCEALLPALTPDFATVRHITNRRNKLLGGKGPKRPFGHGTSEDIHFEELPERIQSVFKNHQGAKSTNPVILLVSREEETLNLLGNLGVDTSGWRSGIKDLLLPEWRIYPSPQRQPGPSRSRYSSNSRARSRSPDRRHGRHASTGSSSSRWSNPREFETLPTGTTPRQTYPPVYVLDVRKLYVKLMQTAKVNGVADIARWLKLTNEDGWCAGNEAAAIISVWKEMASSLAIDEQREHWRSVLEPLCDSSNQTPGSAPEPYVYDSDDDDDPNQIVAQPQKEKTHGERDDPYGFDESDDDD